MLFLPLRAFLCFAFFSPSRCLIYPANGILYLDSDLDEEKLEGKARLFDDSFLSF